MGNKVQFGLKNVHVAPFTVSNGVYSYDTPFPLPGGVELSLEPRGDMTEFYADNMIYYAASNNQGYDGTLSVANITEKFAVEVLGEEKNSADNVLIEKSNTKPKNFALLFEFDGDVKATRHVLYNCTANRPTVSSSTKTASVEPNPSELTFVSSPRETDEAVKTKTTANTTAAVYDAWYDSVYEPNADTTPPTVTVAPTDESASVAVTTTIVWTFSEAIREADVSGANFFLNDASGTEVSGALSVNADQTEVTFTPDSDLAAATDYTAIATKNVKDLAGNSLEQNSVTNFTTA